LCRHATLIARQPDGERRRRDGGMEERIAVLLGRVSVSHVLRDELADNLIVLVLLRRKVAGKHVSGGDANDWGSLVDALCVRLDAAVRPASVGGILVL